MKFRNSFVSTPRRHFAFMPLDLQIFRFILWINFVVACRLWNSIGSGSTHCWRVRFPSFIKDLGFCLWKATGLWITQMSCLHGNHKFQDPLPLTPYSYLLTLILFFDVTREIALTFKIYTRRLLETIDFLQRFYSVCDWWSVMKFHSYKNKFVIPKSHSYARYKENK